ncbi:MAG: glycine cleavage system aminomethyltransferase GcvT [Ignavibacteriales bacterium]|nr:glycine cleavage system aminomethyltransferase GcvT [Ignavibacteriales bacterium]
MKPTAFNALHKKLGAKLVEFAGYEMPIQYTGIIDEHKAVREAVGIFDVSHMGEFKIEGHGALELVQKITVNDAAKLTDGKVQYSAMCYPDGGIVDDLLVYRMKNHFMLVVNAANLQKDFDWIKSNINNSNVTLTDDSDKTSLLAVQGPKSLATLQKLTGANLSSLNYYSFLEADLAGIEMIISRTGYTGELGFELYFDSSISISERIWNAIMEAGKEYNIKPIGLGARDTLRLEMGFCLYGNDIDKSTNPLEAGLAWITKLDKTNFNAKDVLLNVKKTGLSRKLTGFVVDDERAFPRHGYDILSGGEKIGVVTSGTVSPILGKAIGMGYVATNFAEPDSEISILIRNKEVKAKIVKIPFIKK